VSDADRARRLAAAARRVVVFTGAGVSAESGVPTFRGPGGLWKTFRPEQLATPEAFARDPRLVWEWYGWRRERLAACRPNLAHLAIARWMLRREGVTLVTQNVDDLHERGAVEAALDLARQGRLPGAAGVAADGSPEGGEALAAARAAAARVAPIRLHGSIAYVRCARCGARDEHRESVDASTEATLPRCGCGGLLRPDVVWFGEALPERALAAAFEAAAAAELCLVVGTAGAVHPAAAVVHATADAGGRVVVVDPGETAYDAMADVRLWGAAGEVVPGILRDA
jgi:NAD-dependent protein deacetylase/lipoamidase